MQKYRILISILVLFSLTTAQDNAKADSLYKYGNDAMLGENFTLAVTTYEDLIDQGYQHSDLYYNLGNAYYRTNKLGNAIWAFEKGLQLSPRDKDLKFNLSLANARVRDRIEMPQTVILLEKYRMIKENATVMDILLIAVTILMLGSFIYFLKRYYQWHSIWLSRLIISLFVISLLTHLMVLDKYFEISNKQEIIIVQSEVEVFSAPFNRKETIIFRLHEGVKAEITQNQQNWLEIELIDGKKGWILSDKVRRL